MKAKEIVAKYDHKETKGFDESDIATELYSIPDEERTVTENLAEWIAFSLTECSENSMWHTYYGPFLELSNGTCIPSKESITPEVVSYWEQRLNEVSNPILKARYSGLVIDFKTKCDGDTRKKYVESLLDCVDGRYPEHEINCVVKLIRAFRIAVTMKDKDLIARAKTSIVNYEQSATTDYDVGLWGRLFMLILENKKNFEDEEAAFVTRMEDRIARLCEKQIDGKDDERFDVFVIEEGIELLAQYYEKRQKKEEIKRVLDVLNAAFHKGFSTLSVMQINGLLDKLYRLYSLYGLQQESKQILDELQQNSVALSNELTTINASVKIPTQQIDNHVKKMTEGTFEEVMARFLFKYIPEKSKMENELREKVNRNPLIAAFPNQLLDYKGRPSSVIGGIENDFEGHLVHHIHDVLESYHIFMHPVIQTAIEKGLFNVSSIMQYVKDCPFFESDRIPIVEHGLKAYFNGDLVTAIHLLIPQIENAVRNIVEMSNRSTIKLQGVGNGYELKTFDELLRDDAIVQVDEGNLSLYLRVLFTNQRGWNLRNSICHGIAPLSTFNQAAADRVLHALICVSSIRLITS